MEEKHIDMIEPTKTQPVKTKRDTVPYHHSLMRTCKICGKYFTMSDNDVIYWVTKFGNVPQRCPDCRVKKHENESKETK